MSYQGWKNYETWVTALWIDNDENTYNYARSMACEQVLAAPECSQVQSGIWTIDEAKRFNLADALKDYVENDLLPELDASLASDLLRAATSEIDWHEVADHYLED